MGPDLALQTESPALMVAGSENACSADIYTIKQFVNMTEQGTSLCVRRLAVKDFVAMYAPLWHKFSLENIPVAWLPSTFPPSIPCLLQHETKHEAQHCRLSCPPFCICATELFWVQTLLFHSKHTDADLQA